MKTYPGLNSNSAGPFHYTDQTGVDKELEILKEDEFGDKFKRAGTLIDHIDQGKNLH